MKNIAIIGGTGLTSLENFTITRNEILTTPYGETSGALGFGNLGGKEIILLARHGNPHIIPPHKVNYRANIWALHHYGINHIISVNTVGGIAKLMYPCRIVIPNQIIDYTWSRNHTFFEDNINHVTHIDFTRPYSGELRQSIIDCGKSLKLDMYTCAVYGATQGPRLETIAEITRMERDGCDVAGMTGMPEAALAKELDINYASIALVVNWAAGKSKDTITMKIIKENLKAGMGNIKLLLNKIIETI